MHKRTRKGSLRGVGTVQFALFMVLIAILGVIGWATLGKNFSGRDAGVAITDKPTLAEERPKGRPAEPKPFRGAPEG